ncbi:MAG: sulfurtransferase-like selenium metabolism protein YedF [Lachnospiraceae bacterium]|nr:sulfurtransferase-like selenium metabolism protein YedF [Lachnospiraceae bacterium]
MANIVVNAVGEQCPIPVVKATKAIREMKEAGVIEVHVDNEIAVQNLTKLANSKNLKSSAEKKEEKLYVVTIAMDGAIEESGAQDECIACAPDKRGNTVVAIASERMGHGNDELGKVLMKGFIYALSQLEELPKTILFYNGGATITCEESPSVEDLKSMEAQGVEILTCGTCLDYYGLKDKLAVGSVTNMYTIVEKLAQADKIIKQ